mmetsp:Transcript_56933/g.51223  ORF Transcript_56933/g.51223 Transcript_56933/m.51223 type:complete len:616 (+) Transcript_56933:178-2025(+)|eukprot:CAMPEP_0201584018 /NCGR_PEP_ID=MMETSP0190_2-20130828/105475_1 /ASSEMBLY_ACC=CAM_ASM_000263 /TAXON_ID=37353 /ORGANISM="Rosalina sp." /LENGTH=615 /DNA_ID=CAMNT_0048027125 /DNA_START=176 /DNA_END=2023 /DNA_ORIENTATION=+
MSGIISTVILILITVSLGLLTNALFPTLNLCHSVPTPGCIEKLSECRARPGDNLGIDDDCTESCFDLQDDENNEICHYARFERIECPSRANRDLNYHKCICRCEPASEPLNQLPSECPLGSTKIADGNFDFISSSILQIRVKQSFEECQDHCSANPECKSFAYTPVGGDTSTINFVGSAYVWRMCTLYDDDIPNSVMEPREIGGGYILKANRILCTRSTITTTVTPSSAPTLSPVTTAPTVDAPTVNIPQLTFPPIAIDYESFDYGEFDSVVKEGLDEFVGIDGAEQVGMWETLSLSSFYDILDSVMEKTQSEAIQLPILTFVLSYPQFFDEEICRSDFFLTNDFDENIDEPELDDINLEIRADPDEIENLLRPIYENIKSEIDSFGLLLSGELKKTAIAVTYTGSICLDIGIEMCYSQGYGFAFDFNENVLFYQTGLQGMSMAAGLALIDFGGSISFDVSYDILGEIDFVPGNLYSLDVTISPGITGQITNVIIDTIQNGGFNNNNINVLDIFSSDSFGISFLVGVDSLVLNDISTANFIGISFSKTLKEISTSILPSVAFGISRAATMTTTQIKDLVNEGLEADKDSCVAEQLWTIDQVPFVGDIIRPELEIF